MASVKPEFSPSPRPAAAEAELVFSCWLSAEDDDIVKPRPRSNDGLDDDAPIWAAFWSNAVADIAGCGDGA